MKHLLDRVQYWECIKTTGRRFRKGNIYWGIPAESRSYVDYWFIDDMDWHFIITNKIPFDKAFCTPVNQVFLDQYFRRIL